MIRTPYEVGWDDCARGVPLRNGPGFPSTKAYVNGYRECKLNGYAGTKHPTKPQPVRPL
jgi:hypothetical protein